MCLGMYTPNRGVYFYWPSSFLKPVFRFYVKTAFQVTVMYG